MNTNSEITREIMDRFNSAFEEHRPEDLDDLIGEGCVLENTTPAPDGARYEGREACLNFWKGGRILCEPCLRSGGDLGQRGPRDHPMAAPLEREHGGPGSRGKHYASSGRKDR